ncbi:unnamed protein product [Polarella glacialis]|uniref:Uncharacterized protein n=1 Tax=Polarella glacialis TaxID=89957 RepID=A0A813JXZ1_POLGL|nr:unnamed protein product [Polarella glacialis]|mmetsp:Transcript_6333/g.10169  ORF Transcript_6333/g.10169 Transcript_6333/m.10169 type:complete len:104 (+) Transcript_6333:81-392(+)
MNLLAKSAQALVRRQALASNALKKTVSPQVQAVQARLFASGLSQPPVPATDLAGKAKTFVKGTGPVFLLGMGYLYYMGGERDAKGNLKQGSISISIFGCNMPF